MSQKEVKRAQVLDLLIAGKISQQEASKRLGVTTRQVRRLTRRYQAVGLAGLVSKKRGRAEGLASIDQVTARVTAFVAHAKHGDTWRLRKKLFSFGWLV